MPWPISKVVACFNQIVHAEHLPSISENNLEQFSNHEELLNFIKTVYLKSNGKLEIYGTPEVMLKMFEKLDYIPELLYFSMIRGKSKNPISCALSSNLLQYFDSRKKFCYRSKKDTFLNTYRRWILMLDTAEIGEFPSMFYESWRPGFVRRILRGFQDASFDLIPKGSDRPLILELEQFFETDNERNLDLPEGVLTIDWFENLVGEYFEDNDEDEGGEKPQHKIGLDLLLNYLKNAPLATEQEFYKKIYSETLFIIQQTKSIFKNHMEIFTPNSKLSPFPKHQTPVIRRLHSTNFDFYLMKEVKSALRIVMKDRLSDSEDLVIPLESEKERRLGIVYGITPGFFEKLLKKYGISVERFIVLKCLIGEDHRGTTFPIISTYGTHCIPSTDAFEKILYYLTVILKVFQRSTAENRLQIFNWIDNNVIESLFEEKPVFYLIETWKIDQIIDRARKELGPILTEPLEDDILPLKATLYTRNEVFREYQKLTRHLGMLPHHFLDLANRYLNLNKPMTLKNIYDSCTQIVRCFFLSSDNKIFQFNHRQVMFEKRAPNLCSSICKLQHDSELAQLEKAFLELGIQTTSEASESPDNQQLREEQRSRMVEIQLKEKLRTQELSHLEEVRNLKAELEREKAEKMDLKSKMEKIEKESREFKQKYEFLMSENGALRAEMFKNTEFQLKIKEHNETLKNEHNDLVDITGSRLNRLCSRYPESDDVKEAKTDVIKLEDCPDEYVKNVREENQQFQE